MSKAHPIASLIGMATGALVCWLILERDSYEHEPYGFTVAAPAEIHYADANGTEKTLHLRNEGGSGIWNCEALCDTGETWLECKARAPE